MKNFILVTLLLILSSMSFAEVPIEGFRSYKWGSAPTSDMVLVGGDATAVAVYKIKNDTLKIGAAEATTICYFFYKGQLSSVLIGTDTYVDFHTVKEIFSSKYKSLYQPSKYVDRFFINMSSKTSRAYLDYNEFNEVGDIFLYSTNMADEESKDEKLAAERAASDI